MDHNRHIIVIDEKWIVKKYFGRIEPPPKMERLQIIQKVNSKFRVSKFRITNQHLGVSELVQTSPGSTWMSKLDLVHQGDQFPGLECLEPLELLIVHPGEPE